MPALYTSRPRWLNGYLLMNSLLNATLSAVQTDAQLGKLLRYRDIGTKGFSHFRGQRQILIVEIDTGIKFQVTARKVNLMSQRSKICWDFVFCRRPSAAL